MPSLPDLVEDDLTVFAWWNALEHGGQSIDPVDALNYQPVESWEPFDNGVQGQLTDSIDGHPIRFRVKTDGWLTCWIEADNEIDVERTLLNFDEAGGPDLLPNNRLEDHISNIRTELGNPGNYSPEDTGLFYYDHEEATEIGIWAVTEELEDDTGTVSKTSSISLTDQIEVSQIIGQGSVQASGGMESTVSFDGNEIATSSDDGLQWGRLDITNDIGLDNYMFYDLTVEVDSSSSNNSAGEAVGTLIGFYDVLEG